MATMVQADPDGAPVGEERLGWTEILGGDVGPPLGGGSFTAGDAGAQHGVELAARRERGFVGHRARRDGPGRMAGAAACRGDPVLRLRRTTLIGPVNPAGGAVGWVFERGVEPAARVSDPGRVGAVNGGSIYHSHSFGTRRPRRLPGWKVVMPSTPAATAYGLLGLSAIGGSQPGDVLGPRSGADPAGARSPGRDSRARPEENGRTRLQRSDAPALVKPVELAGREWPKRRLSHPHRAQGRDTPMASRGTRTMTRSTYGRIGADLDERRREEGLAGEGRVE